MHVFISYPGNDGLEIAKQAEGILKQFGYKPWVFESHNTWGSIIFEDIMHRIRRWSQVLLYICTDSSLDSSGQRFEVAHALRNPNVKILPIVLDKATIPEVIDIIGYKRLQKIHFESQFKNICQNLSQTMNNIQRLDEEVGISRLDKDLD